MEYFQGQLDYNPFSKDNKDRNYFRDVKENVQKGIITNKEWHYQTFKELLELVLGRFEWTGLPDNMPLYYMERKLITNGSALIYDTEMDGLFVGTGTRSQELNHYEESVGYTVSSPVSDHNKTYILGDDAIMVKNNSDATPDIDLIWVYSKILTEIRVTQTTNLQTMRFPFMLLANEKTKSSIIEQFRQVTAGAPYIMIDPELMEEHGHSADNVFNTDTPYNIDQLQQFYNDIKNEMLTQLGVNTNPSQDKKERLLVDEISSNDDETSGYIQTRLKEREEAAKKASELFNTEITVELTDSFQPEQRESIISTTNNMSNVSKDETGGGQE